MVALYFILADFNLLFKKCIANSETQQKFEGKRSKRGGHMTMYNKNQV